VLLPLLCEPEFESGTFARAFENRFGRTPDCATVQAYDNVRLLLAATREAGLNRPRIRDRIGSLSPWAGEAGAIRWNGLGQNQRQVFLATVRDGAVVPLESPGQAREPDEAANAAMGE
jgi:hypothetical protein